MKSKADTVALDLVSHQGDSTRSHNHFWQAFPKWWALVKIWFQGPDKWRARGFAVASVLLSLANTWLIVGISYAQRNFSTSLSEKNVGNFYASVWQFVGIIAIAAPLFAFSEFVQMRLILAWRVRLSEVFIAAFFTDRAYYRVQHMSGVDNPDQRICQDVASFVESSTKVLDILTKKIFSCIAFAGVLWTVSPALVGVLFAYSIVGTWITTSVFGRQLMSLRFKVLKQEGDLRFSLVRVRENSEAIAFYHGHAPEAKCVMTRLYAVAGTHRVQIMWKTLLEVWRNVYTYATILVPSLFTAPRYFAGEIAFGVVTQAGFAFGRIESALSLIIASLESLSGLAAETERLHDLVLAFRQNDIDLLSMPARSQDADKALLKKRDGSPGDVAAESDAPTAALLALRGPPAQGPPAQQQIVRLQPSEHDVVAGVSDDPHSGHSGHSARTLAVVLRLQHLCVSTPGAQGQWSAGLGRGCVIADDLSLQLLEGQSVLVVGPSGCGKSSLLRTLSGMWTDGSGSITCLEREATMFLPQKPYMPLGTLRQQLLFPAADSSVPDKTLLALAQDVNLPRVAEATADLDREDNWTEIFSLGEQQRIAFLRLFCHRPSLAFLDESTSALDTATEAMLYAKLKTSCQSFVSVGHRMQLVRYHTHVLNWVAPGKWVLMPAHDFSASLASAETGL